MKILVLGDTTAAEALVSEIANSGNHKAVAAGALDHEITDRLTDYFTRARVDAVVDATHPFEAAISHEAAKACRRLGLKHKGAFKNAFRRSQSVRIGAT